MKRYFWLSFCDPHRPKGFQFLGVSIIPIDEGETIADAAMTAHMIDCNPGGEVAGIEFESDRVPVDAVGRLLTRLESEILERYLAGPAH
jgi:hypothetical protein